MILKSIKLLLKVIPNFFTARRYAGTVYAAIECLFVRPSQVAVLQRWLNLGSHKQCHVNDTIAQGL